MQRLLPLLFLLTACSDGPGIIQPPPPPDALIAIGTPGTQVESGQSQTVSPGATLPQPLVVLVTRDGEPFAGQAVSWTVSTGEVVSTTTSDAQGRATMTWKLGPDTGRFAAEATIGAAVLVYYANVE